MQKIKDAKESAKQTLSGYATAVTSEVVSRKFKDKRQHLEFDKKRIEHSPTMSPPEAHYECKVHISCGTANKLKNLIKKRIDDADKKYNITKESLDKVTTELGSISDRYPDLQGSIKGYIKDINNLSERAKKLKAMEISKNIDVEPKYLECRVFLGKYGDAHKGHITKIYPSKGTFDIVYDIEYKGKEKKTEHNTNISINKICIGDEADPTRRVDGKCDIDTGESEPLEESKESKTGGAVSRMSMSFSETSMENDEIASGGNICE